MNKQTILTITESEYNDYMNLLADKVKDYREKYNRLQNTIDNWNDYFNPTSKISGLTIEEMQDLQKSFKEYQHKYFLQWYKLNNELKSKGLAYYNPEYQRRLGDYLIGVVRWTDLLTA